MSSSHPSLRPLRRPERSALCCAEATRFAEWTAKLFDRITNQGEKQPTHEQVKEAKSFLVDEYFKHRNGTTKSHRDRLANVDGALCIHGVFIQALERFAALVIDPPKIAPTSARRPQKKAEPSLADILLGDGKL